MFDRIWSGAGEKDSGTREVLAKGAACKGLESGLCWRLHPESCWGNSRLSQEGQESGARGPGARGSEWERDGGEREERVATSSAGPSPTAEHAGTPARCTVCVNFVVVMGKPSLARCPGKAGREERICALVLGVEFQGKSGFR